MKKKNKISHRQLGPLCGSSSPFQHFEPARVKLNYASIQITDWVSMSAVLVTGPTVTQNSPFLPWRWP